MKYAAEMGHDIHTKVHENWFRHSKADRHRQEGDSINLYLFFQNMKSRLKRGETYLAFLPEIIRF
jgi:hypothetical protein